MAAGSSWVNGPGRQMDSHIRAVALALVACLALAACGQSMQTPLPDITSKNDPERRTPMTRAEQKQAIDGLIAKRDDMQQSQSK